MTSQISNNLSTHVVLTYSNNCYFITQKQEIALRSMNDNDRFYVNTFMVRVNTIKEILPIEEYYQNHPDKRPQYDNYENKTLEKIPYSAQRHLNGLKEMRRGFLNHFSGRELPAQSKKILETMDFRINNFKFGDKVDIAGIYFGIKN